MLKGEITQYVMSCRVLGMNIEVAALIAVINRLRDDGAMELTGIIVPSEVNAPCRGVFESCGFKRRAGLESVFDLVQTTALNSTPHVKVNYIS